jgi:hypothetical protein
MRLSPAWLGGPAEIAAEGSVGVVEPLAAIAEFVNRAAAFAVIVGMFVGVAENKMGMGCVVPRAYIGPGQDLPGGRQHHYELVLHNLGMNVGFPRQGYRSVSRNVRMPETSFCFSLSSSHPWYPQGDICPPDRVPVHFSRMVSQFQ